MPQTTSTSTSLPSQRTLIACILSQLPFRQSKTHSSQEPNPLHPETNLRITNPSLKPLLLTLHCLFPTDLLPALDLLDRGLVTRLTLASSIPVGSDEKTNVVYYVRSSHQQQQRSRGFRRAHNAGNQDGGTSYEVRLRSWGCTCAAFTFAAFSPGAAAGLALERGGDDGVQRREELGFGGLGLEGEVPICKHLLACALAERMDIGVEEREVEREELAGWAAGWGG